MVRNNRFLVDTNVFIWWMEKKKPLGKDISHIISDPNNYIFLSLASIWEMSIKEKIKKLKLPKDWKKDIQSGTFEILPISIDHIFGLDYLPLLHKDPFDRILVAQANIEGLTLITSDPKIWKYNVPLIKA